MRSVGGLSRKRWRGWEGWRWRRGPRGEGLSLFGAANRVEGMESNVNSVGGFKGEFEMVNGFSKRG